MNSGHATHATGMAWQQYSKSCSHNTNLSPSHRTAITRQPWRPRESTRSSCGRRISEKTLHCVHRRYFTKFYAYADSDPTAMRRTPWAMSLRCHGAFGMPAVTLRCVSCDARVARFRGDLTALVWSMFKTWWRPRWPWRPCCDLHRCHGALWPGGDQWRCGRLQRGRRPVWVGYKISGMFSWDSIKSLTHWGRDQMATMFQTTFSNAFTWIKVY